MTIFIWTPLEIAANIMTAVCIFLAGRNNIHTWWTGIVACVLFGVLFFNVQLYADSMLQVFFLVTGVIGWMNWKSDKDKNSKPIIKTTDKLIPYFGLAIGVTSIYGLILHTYTDAYAPWIDSTFLTFSVVAHFLLMRRNIYTWPVWLFVNTLSVPLFWTRELYLTSILYGFFWVNAIVAYFQWNKIQHQETVV
jgi:nicotinamide mononucleotide transporter